MEVGCSMVVVVLGTETRKALVRGGQEHPGAQRSSPRQVVLVLVVVLALALVVVPVLVAALAPVGLQQVEEEARPFVLVVELLDLQLAYPLCKFFFSFGVVDVCKLGEY